MDIDHIPYFIQSAQIIGITESEGPPHIYRRQGKYLSLNVSICCGWRLPPLSYQSIFFVSVAEMVLMRWLIDLFNIVQSEPSAKMTKKQMTLVYYHVPEDKDDPECPNVFGVPYNKASLKLSHIYEAFPLKGTYLFRFKTACEGQVVWLDLPDIEAKLPTFKDKVYVKATRVSWNDSKLHSYYKDKPANSNGQKNHPNSNNIDFFQHSAPQKKEEPKNIPTAQNPQLDFLNEKTIPQPKNQSNLLEQVHRPKNENANSLGLDFLGTGSPSVQKKSEINLMQGFPKHGDLI